MSNITTPWYRVYYGKVTAICNKSSFFTIKSSWFGGRQQRVWRPSYYGCDGRHTTGTANGERQHTATKPDGLWHNATGTWGKWPYQYATMQKSPVSESLSATSPAGNSLPARIYDEYNKSYFRASPAGSLNKKSSVPLFWYRAFIIEYILTNRQIKEV